MNFQQFVVAIDGLAASGKSTIAIAIARHFSWERLDSGSFYRFVTLYLLKHRINWKNESLLKRELAGLHFAYLSPDHYLEGKVVTEHLRSPEVEKYVSEVARIPAVREKVNSFLREYAIGKRIVVEGRDIGTVVFPEAQVKIFLVAREEIRAQRRAAQNKRLPFPRSDAEAEENIRLRDFIDSTRDVAPTRPAEDAVIIDTSSLNLSQTIDLVIKLIEERMS